MATPDPKILDAFRNRLLSVINRSHLMRVSVTKTGRLLDLFRLESLQAGLSKQVLTAVVGDNRANIDFSWRFARDDTPLFEPEKNEENQGEPKHPDQKLIEEMLTRIIREGALAKREMGIQTVWLGYPLLHVVLGDAETPKQLLAPIFLWPISIEQDQRRAGRFCVRRDGVPRFNGAMAVWIKNNLGTEMDGPTEDELADLTWETLPNLLSRLAQSFDLPAPDLDRALDPIPALKTLLSQRKPKVIHSAAMGYFRWQNERLLADIEAIKDMAECPAPVSGYVSGMPLDKVDERIPSPVDEDQFLVYDADFSQEHVVWNSRGKKGLVVHGPPGTGKSQTIVNIVADALAHDRTVLMVCQKQAATKVVLERLRKVGLADLCMEVHDADKERVPVFKEIREQVQKLPNEMPKSKTQEQRQRLSREIAALKRDLDAIAKGIHEKHCDVGLSYREIKAREGRILNSYSTARSLPTLEAILRKISSQALDEVCRHAHDVGRWFKEADPFNNPWRAHQPNLHDDPATRADVEEILARLREQDQQHQEQIGKGGIGQPLPRDVAGFGETIREFVSRLREFEQNPDATHTKLTQRWLIHIRKKGLNEIQACRQRCAEAIALSSRVVELPLDSGWGNRCDHLSDEELEALRMDAKCVIENHDRWWWWRWMKGYSIAAKAILNSREEASRRSGIELANDFLFYLEARKQHEQLAQTNQSLVPGIKPSAGSAGHQAAFSPKAGAALESAAWLCDQEDKFAVLQGLLDKFQQQENLTGEITKLQQSLQRANLVSLLMENLTRLEAFLKPEAIAPVRIDVLAGKSIRPWLDALASRFISVPALLRWEIDCRQRQPLDQAIFESLEGYELGRTHGQTLPCPPNSLPDDNYGDWWRTLIEFSALRTWLALCHEKHPELLQFNPEQHEKKRSQLRELLQQKRGLEAQRIRELWLAKQVPIRSEPWNKLFQQRGKNAKRLRQAVKDSLPRGLLKLRPCWLVDPETAAHVFPLDPGLFDVVIFDEASQCPIECAVPAIFRGKTLIVSGDAKQLPPTSFFSTRVKVDEGEDDEDDTASSEEAVSTEDRQYRQINANFLINVEDLLDASIGNLPESRLLVHYRSDYPALIEFSNRAFYHGQLEAPPARMNASNGTPPIHYCQVNGLYDSHVNREEARKVLEILKEIWLSEGKSPTSGIVTFNLHQRDLIEDLLEKECQDNAAFAARYQEEVNRKEDNQDVGFFVKNLENVQGDERDTMIFSTTFGRNARGVFLRNFGKVCQDGGERRLNVAVTRSKHKIIIVSSMPIEEISEALTATAGPGMNLKPRCYLQLYLAYARAVSAGDQKEVKRILDRLSQARPAVQTRDGPESPLEEEVFQELQKLGLHVECQVGESGFRIDLAVRHRNPDQGYLLGIECDGASYHSDRAAHLRDVWRETILRGRGWKIHRIWSTSWWYRRGEEIGKLLDAINLATAGSVETPSNGSVPERKTPVTPPVPANDASAKSSQGLPSAINPPAFASRPRVKRIRARTDGVNGTELHLATDPLPADRQALEAAGFKCKGAAWAWIATCNQAEAKPKLKAAGFCGSPLS